MDIYNILLNENFTFDMTSDNIQQSTVILFKFLRCYIFIF